jgi:hypothetical protein
VVGNPTLNSGDSAIKTRLEIIGYVVTVKDDSVSSSSDATGKDIVLISATIDEATVNSKFRTVSVPVLVMEAFIYNNMLMATADNYGDLTYDPLQTQMTVSTSGHPLTAGLSGLQNVYTSAQDMNWAYLPATAIKAASDIWNSYPIFGYDKGTTMISYTAPARRVGFFLRDVGAIYWASQGSQLFEAAVTWAVTGN